MTKEKNDLIFVAVVLFLYMCISLLMSIYIDFPVNMMIYGTAVLVVIIDIFLIVDIQD